MALRAVLFLLSTNVLLGVSRAASTPTSFSVSGVWIKEELESAKKERQQYLFAPQFKDETSDDDDDEKESSKFRFIIRTNDQQMKARSSNQIKSPSDLNMEERETLAKIYIGRSQMINNVMISKEQAIKTMQRNHGLEITGELNDETVRMMMKPRCGRPDIPSDYTFFGGNPTWDKSVLTYKILGYSPDMSPCQIRNAFKKAFRVWEEQTEITFVEEESDAKADIDILFGYGVHPGDPNPFDEEHGLLAHAFPPGIGVGGDTHFDESEFWTLGLGKVAETIDGNADGAECKFPFIYKKKEYYSCTNAGRKDDFQWCSTTENFDKDGKFGFCPSEHLYTYGGNSDMQPCHFPFQYRGRNFYGCTKYGRKDGYRWCSTTANYDVDQKMGLCPDRVHMSYLGNGDGEPCHFPFNFQGYTYHSCTPVGRDRPWCSTTDDYDRDGKWGYCKDSGYSLVIVAAHEFGHALGLEHSRTEAALMFPGYEYMQNFKLHQDDIDGIKALYGDRKSKLPPLILEKCGGKNHGTKYTFHPTPAPPTTLAPTSPDDLCRLKSVDAIMYLAPEIFIFKGYYFWRMRNDGYNRQGPYPIASQWIGGPEEVDAAYYRPYQQNVVLIKGQRIWIFHGFTLKPGYPKQISTLGIRELKVNAALESWTSDRNEPKTFFFTNKRIYSYDETTQQQVPGFPIDIRTWDKKLKGIGGAIKDVDPESVNDKQKFQLIFKGKKVFYLDNETRKVGKKITLKKWLRCGKRG